jgi:hypothetical protein
VEAPSKPNARTTRRPTPRSPPQRRSESPATQAAPTVSGEPPKTIASADSSTCSALTSQAPSGKLELLVAERPRRDRPEPYVDVVASEFGDTKDRDARQHLVITFTTLPGGCSWAERSVRPSYESYLSFHVSTSDVVGPGSLRHGRIVGRGRQLHDLPRSRERRRRFRHLVVSGQAHHRGAHRDVCVRLGGAVRRSWQPDLSGVLRSAVLRREPIANAYGHTLLHHLNETLARSRHFSAMHRSIEDPETVRCGVGSDRRTPPTWEAVP